MREEPAVRNLDLSSYLLVPSKIKKTHARHPLRSPLFFSATHNTIPAAHQTNSTVYGARPRQSVDRTRASHGREDIGHHQRGDTGAGRSQQAQDTLAGSMDRPRVRATDRRGGYTRSYHQILQAAGSDSADPTLG